MEKKRLTRTGQPPAGQSTRRFPRAKSDRHHQTLTYLVSPRHRESPPSEFHVPDSRRRGCEKTASTGPAAAPLGIFFVTLIARTLSSRTSFPLSFSPRQVRPLVRSLLRSSPDRALHSGAEEGDRQRAFYQTRLRSRHGIRIYAILATSGSRHAVSRDKPALSSRQADAGDTHGKIRPRDSHTLRAARTHNARTRFVMAIFGGKQLRAPTARRGSLRRPASGTSLRDSSKGASFSTGDGVAAPLFPQSSLQ